MNKFMFMIDLSKVDISPINKMALILGISTIGVLIGSLLFGKLLQMLGLPNLVIRPLISVIGAISFLYIIVYFGDAMF